MHKKSIEAAKALKEEDGSCDGDGAASASSECGKPQRQSLHVGPSSVSVDVGHDLGPPPHLASSGHHSGDRSLGCGDKGGGTADDTMRSDSIAALRAKV